MNESIWCMRSGCAFGASKRAISPKIAITPSFVISTDVSGVTISFYMEVPHATRLVLIRQPPRISLPKKKTKLQEDQRYV